MKIGSLVECISTFTGVDNFYGDQLPTVHNLYVIRDMEEVEGDIGIRVEEIINPLHYFVDNGRRIQKEISFLIDKFREIQPPMEINIEELMVELV